MLYSADGVHVPEQSDIGRRRDIRALCGGGWVGGPIDALLLHSFGLSVWTETVERTGGGWFEHTIS